MRRKIGPLAGIRPWRLNQVGQEVYRILAAMQKGVTLTLHYQNGRAIWRLTSGLSVTSQAAAIVIASDEVVGLGDSLFPGHSGQTWRYRDV